MAQGDRKLVLPIATVEIVATELRERAQSYAGAYANAYLNERAEDVAEYLLWLAQAAANTLPASITPVDRGVDSPSLTDYGRMFSQLTGDVDTGPTPLAWCVARWPLGIADGVNASCLLTNTVTGEVFFAENHLEAMYYAHDYGGWYADEWAEWLGLTALEDMLRASQFNRAKQRRTPAYLRDAYARAIAKIVDPARALDLQMLVVTTGSHVTLLVRPFESWIVVLRWMGVSLAGPPYVEDPDFYRKRVYASLPKWLDAYYPEDGLVRRDKLDEFYARLDDEVYEDDHDR